MLDTPSSMTISRRRFLGSAAAISAGFTGLGGCNSAAVLASSVRHETGFGPLLEDPDAIIALPEGFSYRIVSRWGERMSDGFIVPSRHDGMAAFPGPDGTTLLVRNHEVTPGADPSEGAFGADLALLNRLDRSLLYDAGTNGVPALGGTTTLQYDTERQRLISHHLSVGGTLVNCAGGPTPWGTWVTCEEIVSPAEGRWARDHGYNFEVRASLDGLPVPAVPLKAMGRFKHEAVAVHPPTSIVYQTEDLSDGLLYRFIPEVPGDLARGGRLQALAVRDRSGVDTRNFEGRGIRPDEPMAVDWIDLHDVEAPADDLRHRGHAAGAARFARGEGIYYGERGGRPEVYVACTNGGEAFKGQIWRYRPSPEEGSSGERRRPGTLELFVEPNDGTIIENADNLTVAPWGDLVVCEDGTGDDYLLGITPQAEIYKLAHNLSGTGEFAGACFSPDGSTFFVNMQAEGWTLAITGPWTSPRS
jgi:secreted PhoX family phosphatase